MYLDRAQRTGFIEKGLADIEKFLRGLALLPLRPRRWQRSSWVKAAARAAELAPGTTTFTMRHSIIGDLAHAGLDLLTVAQISGPSVAMIERH